jgi:aspartate aminotransferase-like enzyme
MRKRGFTLGGGYDAWKSSTFRIGHMGEVRPSDLDVLFAEIEEVVACTAS